MARRSYQQFCGLARALDLVGERWTLLAVRNLLLGPRRYSDLLSELPGITTNLLAKRLKELEAAKLIVREERPPPVAATVYRLTEIGAALEPAVMELARWGGRYMDSPRSSDTVNLAWGLLSLKRRYRGGLRGVVGLEAGERRFELTFTPDYLRVWERPAEAAGVTARGSDEAFRRLFFGTPGGRAAGLGVEGDKALWQAALAALGVGSKAA